MGKIKNIFTRIKFLIFGHKKLSLAVLIVLIIAAVILFPKGSKHILTATVNKQDIVKTVSVTGNVYAQTSVNLTFQIAGQLAYLGVKQGDTVKEGQVIATLDQRTAQKNLEQALIAYSLQRNTFDQTQTNYQNRTPQEALNDSMKIILQDNQYNLNSAINSVELQDLTKQLSVLTTPISGIVTRADADTAGVNVIPTTTFTVTDPNSLEFQMEVDEADIGQVKVGQNVQVSMDAFPNTTINLKINRIDFVSHVSSSGGNAFYVYAKLPNPQNYRVGMSGNADIIIDSKNNVLSIPSSSVFDNNYVYVQVKNGFRKRQVGLGLQSDTQAQVLSGLSNGDTVAVDPNSVAPSMIAK